MSSPSGNAKWNASGKIVVGFLVLVILAALSLVVVPFFLYPPPGVLGTPPRTGAPVDGVITAGVVPMYRTLPPPAVVPPRSAVSAVPAPSTGTGAP